MKYVDRYPIIVTAAFGACRDFWARHLGFAVVYNAIAVPIAIMGLATPLVAAVAMSLSSVIVVANALRLRAPAPVQPPNVAPAPLGATS